MNDRFKQVACIVVLLGFGFVCGRLGAAKAPAAAPGDQPLRADSVNIVPPGEAPTMDLHVARVRHLNGPVEDFGYRDGAPTWVVTVFTDGRQTTYSFQQPAGATGSR